MSAIQDLRETVARLRGPGGCPWDQEQDHRSLADCLMEECCELLDTIDRLDMEHMREELGDVLLQVVFHAQLAEEQGLFDLEAVAAEVNTKLIKRHPHVFGDGDLLATAGQVLKQWERLKAAERADKPERGPRKGIFKHLPPQLPALLYARDVCKEIRKHGYELPDLVRGGEETSVSPSEEEQLVGQQLFHVVSMCQEKGIDPESALRRYASAIVQNIEVTAKPSSDVTE